jgi:hypothetical protein
MTIPALSWVAEFHDSFNKATDGISPNFTIEDQTDPLKKHVVFHLSEPLGGKSYNPFQNIAHGYAKNNGCVIERIYNNKNKLTMVVLIKRRLGPVRNKNPLLSDK